MLKFDDIEVRRVCSNWKRITGRLDTSAASKLTKYDPIELDRIYIKAVCAKWKYLRFDNAKNTISSYGFIIASKIRFLTKVMVSQYVSH